MTTIMKDNPNNVLGVNSGDNQYNSSSVYRNADGSILERLEYIQAGQEPRYTANNYLAVTADLGAAGWSEVATHEVFNVTGLVRMRIVAEVTETGDDTSGDTSTIQLGTEEVTNQFIAATQVDDLLLGELWFDATPTEKAQATATVMLDEIVNGIDVGYEIAAEASTAGIIVFHCWWDALNSTGAVVAGDGTAMV